MMKHNHVFLIKGEATAELALTPLLGKTCREHVERTLADASLAPASDAVADSAALLALLTDDAATALLVREDAPCLNAATYTGLLEEAERASRPAAVLSGDLQTPLAIAIGEGQLRELAAKDAFPLTLAKLVERFDEAGVAMKVVHRQEPEAYIAVTDATSFAAAFRYLRAKLVKAHMDGGVIILDPERTIIERDVSIGAGTIVYAGNMLQGRTAVGCRCTLLPNNRMSDATVGDDTTVESSVLIRCKVGAHTTVGPYAYLRPDANVGEHCRIGDFVEIKNSSIDDGTKVSHLTYVGDSDLGKDINLGCGVVFVNYDGKVKQRSRVDDHAFIGCNCNLVAPVHIGRNAYLAAGSTVVDDVPDDALFVARSRGVVKEDWVKRRTEQGKL